MMQRNNIYASYAYMHTYIHTYIHTYNTCVHTYTYNTCIHTYRLDAGQDNLSLVILQDVGLLHTLGAALNGSLHMKVFGLHSW